MADIMEKPSRETLAAYVEELKRRRGQCVLDGVKFDAKLLRDAEEQLAALDDAEAETVHRQADAARTADAARITELRAQLAEKYRTFGGVVGIAQSHVDELVGHILDLKALARSILQLSTQLGAPAGAFQQPALETRLSHYLSRALAKCGTASSFGILSFGSTLGTSDWMRGEADATARQIESALTGAKPAKSKTTSAPIFAADAYDEETDR